MRMTNISVKPRSFTKNSSKGNALITIRSKKILFTISSNDIFDFWTESVGDDDDDDGDDDDDDDDDGLILWYGWPTEGV